MAISGITTTSNNGVERITNTQNITGTGTIDGETIVLDDGDARLKASSNGSVVVTNSQIKLDSDTTGSNDGNAVINYGGRSVTTTVMKFVDSTILTKPFTGRHNIMVTWLENVTVIEGGSTHKMFCYTATDSHLENVLFKGINVWEVYRAPDVAFNIKVSDVGFGYLNWEAGRLDFFGFATNNITKGHIWHGTGNSGRNYSYHWNPDSSVDFEKLYLTHVRNRVYIGYTATWEFLDLISGAKVSDVLLIFKDNRSGSVATKGTYTTEANGHLKGTYDSQNDTTGSDIVRPTLFVRDKQIIHVDTGHPGAYDYPVVTISGGQGDRQKNYDIDEVAAYIEIRSYKHLSVPGFEPGDEFVITTEIGAINADLTVSRYSKKFLTPDNGITVVKSVALAYSNIDTLDKLYDRCKAEWRDNNGYPLPEKDGVKVDLGSTAITFDGGSGTAYSYATSTITIKTDGDIAIGSKFSAVKTTGNITAKSSAGIDGITFDGDLYFDQATDLEDVTVTGDLRVNTGANSTLDFSNVQVSGSVYNDDTSHTLTINSEDGSSLTAGDAGTGNGQTNIQHPVTLKVTVKDSATKAAINGVRVFLEDSSSGTDIMNLVTNSSGIVSMTYNYSSDINLRGWARKGTTSPVYLSYQMSGTITASGYEVTILMTRED